LLLLQFGRRSITSSSALATLLIVYLMVLIDFDFISYLEMAMNGSLDNETRDNLVRSHAASKVSRYLSSVEAPEANRC